MTIKENQENKFIKLEHKNFEDLGYKLSLVSVKRTDSKPFVDKM